MQKRSELKLFAMVFLATTLSLVCLLRFRVVERLSYAMERGRLQALRETLATDQKLTELAWSSRTVATLAAPAVVSIETDLRPEITQDAIEQTADASRSPIQANPPGNESTDQRSHLSEKNAQESTRWPDVEFRVRQGLGSGFIFDAEKGYIVTNAHVVEGAERIRIYFSDGEQTEARVLGSSPGMDLAVLQVSRSELHALPLGTSDDIRPGDDVLAFGNPFGLDGTVTKGIVSAVDRRNVDIGGSHFSSLIQTDAVITPGSSGGPLLNMLGEVIGINTAMATDTGLYGGVGFAIPTKVFRSVLDDLIDGGPSMLGIMIGSVRYWQEEVRSLGWDDQHGVLVTDIIPGMSAEKSGVKAHDIIVALDGTRIESTGQLGEILGRTKPGSSVKLTIWRDRHELVVPMVTERRYAPR